MESVWDWTELTLMISCPNEFPAKPAEMLRWCRRFNGWRGTTGLQFWCRRRPVQWLVRGTRAFDFSGNDLVGMIVALEIYDEDGALSKV